MIIEDKRKYLALKYLNEHSKESALYQRKHQDFDYTPKEIEDILIKEKLMDLNSKGETLLTDFGKSTLRKLEKSYFVERDIKINYWSLVIAIISLLLSFYSLSKIYNWF